MKVHIQAAIAVMALSCAAWSVFRLLDTVFPPASRVVVCVPLDDGEVGCIDYSKPKKKAARPAVKDGGA